MSDGIEIVNEMRAVTISREYGSGRGEIAARLAKRLGWRLIDHTIVECVARAMGTSQEEAEAHDEHAEGILVRLLNSLQCLDPAFTAYAPPGAVLSDEAYRDAVERIVRAAAARGHVVIVGRGSQVLLAERRDVLRVRTIASLEQRIAYVMQLEGLDQQAAAPRIRMKDHERTKYLETEYHRKPDEAHLYDIVLNMSFLDPTSAVNVICLTLNHKARQLCAQMSGAGQLQVYRVPPVDRGTSAHRCADAVVFSGLLRLCSPPRAGSRASGCQVTRRRLSRAAHMRCAGGRAAHSCIRQPGLPYDRWPHWRLMPLGLAAVRTFIPKPGSCVSL